MQAISRVTAAASLIVLVMAVDSPVAADGTHAGDGIHMPGAAASGFPGAPPRIDQLVPQGIGSAPPGAAALGSAASSPLSTGADTWNPGAYVDPATGQTYASYDAYQQSRGANGAPNTTAYRNFPADGLPPRLFYPFYPNSPYYRGNLPDGGGPPASSFQPSTPSPGPDPASPSGGPTASTSPGYPSPQGSASAPPAGVASGSVASSSPSTGTGTVYVDPATGQAYASYDAYQKRYVDPATGAVFASYNDYAQYQLSLKNLPPPPAYSNGLSPIIYNYYLRNYPR